MFSNLMLRFKYVILDQYFVLRFVNGINDENFLFIVIISLLCYIVFEVHIFQIFRYDE